MKTTHSLSLLALASIATLLAGPALAQDSYYYGGLSAGKSRANLNEQAISNSLLGAGQSASVSSTKPKDNGYKVFGGYQFNRNFAVELGYFHLGQYAFDANTTPAGTLHGVVRVQGANLDLVGLMPITDRFSALARVGVNYARSLDTFTTTGTATVSDHNPSERKASYKMGVGLQYAMADWVQMRLEAERYKVSDGVNDKVNANMYSVGLVFPFGRTEAPVRRAAAEPVYLAPAPAPEPVVVAPLPAPVVAFANPTPKAVPLPQRVSFSAESMFSFDRYEIQPAGKQALDGFVRELQGTSYTAVTVEGHTDRLGSTAYNQKLSQERAEAVKAYLVAEGRLDPAKVNAVGKSESMPVTKPEDCKGQKKSAKLVACLQPDRRVEIEVSGTR